MKQNAPQARLILSTALKFSWKFFRKRSFFDQNQQPLNNVEHFEKNFLILYQGQRDMIDLNFLIFHQGPRDIKNQKSATYFTRL